MEVIYNKKRMTEEQKEIFRSEYSPEIEKLVEEFCNKYDIGYFDLILRRSSATLKES